MKKILCLLMSLSIIGALLVSPIYADISLLGLPADSGLTFELDVSTKTDVSGNDTAVTVKGTFNDSETVGKNKIDYIYFNSEKNDVVSALRMPISTADGDSSSIEMWAKPYGTDENERALFAISRTTVDNASFYAAFKENTMTVFLNGQQKSIDVSKYIGKWSHFVFQRKYADGKAYVEAYINANLVMSMEFDGEKEDEGKKFVYIGSFGTLPTQLSRVFRGNLAEARIYSKLLTESNIFGLYTDKCDLYGLGEEEPTPTPIVPTTSPTVSSDPGEETPAPTIEPTATPIPSKGIIFDMDLSEYDGSQTMLTDKTGKAVKINGNPQIKIQNGIGKTFSYPYFNGNAGNNISIEGSSFAQISNLDRTSVEFWYQPCVVEDKWPKFFSITSGAANSGSWWCENGTSDGGYFICKQASTSAFRTNGVVTNGVWTHAVITREFDSAADTVSYKGYINGELIGSGVVSDTSALSDSGAMKFGSIGGGADGYTGGFSCIKIYDKILSDTDVLKNYENEKSLYTSPVFVPVSGEISKTEGEIVMRTESGFNVSDILSKGITVTDAQTGEKFLNASAVQTGGDEFTVKFGQYVKYGDSIRISSPYKDAYNFVNVTKGTSSAEIKLYNAENREISTIEGQNRIKAMIKLKNSADTSCDYRYAVIARAENNAAICAKSGEISVSGDSTENVVETLSDLENVKNIWLCVWEKNGSALIPIYAMPKTIN